MSSVPPAQNFLTVVVLAVAADKSLVTAIRSLLMQDTPCDIIVVNSNGGNAAAVLGNLGGKVKLIEVEKLLYAGGARNLGLRAITTPFVAFLACDCQAAPGWVRERLRFHMAGHSAVSSAMLHDRPWHLVAWADQLMLFASRLPHLPASRAILYGVSFSREVFERYGLFDESLRSGEDSDFLKRLAPEDRPIWAPSVVTLHHNNTKLLRYLKEHYVRGRRSGIEMRKVFGSKPKDLMSYYARLSWLALGLAWLGLRGPGRVMAVLSIPIVTLGSMSKIAGILSMRHLIPKIDAGEKVYLE